MAFSPETQSRPNQPPIAQDDFFVLTRPLMEMRILRNRQRLIETWAWLKKFVQKYPETGRLLSTQVFFAYHFSNIATEIGVDPKSLNIPLDEELEQLAAKAFALEPNRTGVATTAGLVFQARGNLSEAQRCFSRACQLDRKNEYATSALVKLYEDADRPKDALATIDFYARAGGRHPFLLWKSMQIAFQNEMAQPFLLYYGAYVEEQEIFPQLESQRIWALIKTQQYDTALKSLDYLDDSFKEPARDRFYTRALCQIEGKNDEAKFLEMVEAGLNLKGEPESEGLLGTAFEPCAPLWSHVKNLCSQTDLRRFNFEKFLYERGLLDWEFFARDDEDENENDETEKELRGHYRCILIQPLSPEVPAYAGWVQIPRDEKAYAVTWLVLAENEDEAKKLALDVQNHCYILPAEVFECEKIDSYYSDKSMVTHQGNRFPAEQLSHEA